MPEHRRAQGEAALEEAIEDVPMCRYSNPIPACDRRDRDSRGDLTAQLERLQSALACQTQLLVDLLGAVNALTAAVLTQPRDAVN
jgi:hypothetical protein